ncbi:hypothetical protein PPSIR1_16870 [Plesiocystis pacifica SIR-1]|uniref:Uncharacterized protein n=1 Tax=Plesiocystis pacifica SIR-1 TaxID=391625 RepID=A6GJA4_9BACT|nr:tetratricopeptide repeat protein [Plesiocystis pacifica]EDM74049.1 hypothetical protein PPSIR1_16870 [Plesiocystis pacifica SIR-1]
MVDDAPGERTRWLSRSVKTALLALILTQFFGELVVTQLLGVPEGTEALLYGSCLAFGMLAVSEVAGVPVRFVPAFPAWAVSLAAIAWAGFELWGPLAPVGAVVLGVGTHFVLVGLAGLVARGRAGGRFDEARELLASVSELSPERDEAWMWLADAVWIPEGPWSPEALEHGRMVLAQAVRLLPGRPRPTDEKLRAAMDVLDERMQALASSEAARAEADWAALGAELDWLRQELRRRG